MLVVSNVRSLHATEIMADDTKWANATDPNLKVDNEHADETGGDSTAFDSSVASPQSSRAVDSGHSVAAGPITLPVGQSGQLPTMPSTST